MTYIHHEMIITVSVENIPSSHTDTKLKNKEKTKATSYVKSP